MQERAGTPITPAPVKVPFDSWWTLAVVTALYVAAYLDRFIATMVVPEIKADLNLTDTQIGLILGPAFAISYALFSLPSGWAADRFSRRMVIFWGTILFALGTMMSGLAQSFAMLLMLRIAVGIGESSLVPAALSLVTQKFPKERLTTAISIFSMGPKVGVAVAFGVGGVVVAAAGVLVSDVHAFQGLDAWRLVFLFTGLPSLLIGLFCLSFREPVLPRARTDQPSGADVLRFVRARWSLFGPMLVGIGTVMICGQSLVAWVPAYLHRQFAWEPLGYGPILGVISAVGAMSLVVKGMVMDRLYARGIRDIHLRFFTWLLIGTYPAALAAFLVSDRLFFVVSYAVVSIITIPCIAYASVAIQMVTPPAMRGRVFALLSIPLAVVGGLGPPIVGTLTDHLFGSEQMLGRALAVLMGLSLPIAIVALRLALPGLRGAIEANLQDGSPFEEIE